MRYQKMGLPCHDPAIQQLCCVQCTDEGRAIRWSRLADRQEQLRRHMGAAEANALRLRDGEEDGWLREQRDGEAEREREACWVGGMRDHVE